MPPTRIHTHLIIQKGSIIKQWITYSQKTLKIRTEQKYKGKPKDRRGERKKEGGRGRENIRGREFKVSDI